MRYLLFTTLLWICSCSSQPGSKTGESAVPETSEAEKATLILDGESHFNKLVQLTAEGENAEAYWSFDNSKLVMQRTNEEEGVNCDQIYYGELDKIFSGGSFDLKLVSTGNGKTTCSYFMPGNKEIVYASTHLDHENCPPKLDKSAYKDYVWQIHPEFEIFRADLDGKILQQYTDNDFYDAEATVSAKGDKIVFTSNRSGDLELYTMNIDGSDVEQITTELGYDGGAFFSADGSKLVWRSSRPKTEEAIKKYKGFLAQNLVSPSDMEIYIANTDGSNIQQVTALGGANWAPFFHPSGEKIIFCSNHKTGRFPFNLFLINTDGSGLEQVTFDETFDSFPMFSHDGNYLSFSSNRNNGGGRSTNLFVAEWKD